MSGWLLLLTGGVVAGSEVAIGYLVANRAGAQAGRMIMLGAPLTFLVCLALAMGWIPVDGIAPIGAAS